MAQSFEVTEQVDAGTEAAWATLTDWERAPEWMNGIESMSASGPTEVGTTLTFRARGKDRTSEIVAVDPGRSVTLRSVQGKVTADYRYTCEADGEGSRVTLNAGCETEGLLMGLLGPIIGKLMARSDGGQVTALKALVEKA